MVAYFSMVCPSLVSRIGNQSLRWSPFGAGILSLCVTPVTSLSRHRRESRSCQRELCPDRRDGREERSLHQSESSSIRALSLHWERSRDPPSHHATTEFHNAHNRHKEDGQHERCFDQSCPLSSLTTWDRMLCLCLLDGTFHFATLFRIIVEGIPCVWICYFVW